MLVKARLMAKVLDGIDFMSEETPVGREYLIDLDQKRVLCWYNHEHGRQRDLNCVWDVLNGGWLPMELLDMVV